MPDRDLVADERVQVDAACHDVASMLAWFQGRGERFAYLRLDQGEGTPRKAGRKGPLADDVTIAFESTPGERGCRREGRRGLGGRRCDEDPFDAPRPGWLHGRLGSRQRNIRAGDDEARLDPVVFERRGAGWVPDDPGWNAKHHDVPSLASRRADAGDPRPGPRERSWLGDRHDPHSPSPQPPGCPPAERYGE